MTNLDARIRAAFERWLNKEDLVHRWARVYQANLDDQAEFHLRAAKRIDTLNVDPQDKSIIADMARNERRYHLQRHSDLIMRRRVQ